ncbi:MAG: valine--tRNA ligase [Deferribacteres bacterium]|nr:valine--tRNA ligase [Deferribacteres bacterium]
MKQLPKVYNPKEVEGKWYQFWQDKGFFHADENDDSRPTYSIVIPPPNVTGSLHMGHALNSTLQDILCRWKRMEGYNVLWMPGTDHAGIATQTVVERELAKEGKSRWELGREEFLKKVWEWKEKYGNYIVEQLKRLGCSCDWDRIRFTMDEGFSRAVREVFVSLYEEGLIYKGEYIVNWCPRCHTALSDLEVEYKEEQGSLWYIKYPLADGSGFITVATTRPETMLGDTAVAVNPNDERYKDFVGKKVVLPIVGREIPVIGDEYVDPEFGTGALKITPAHDPYDFEIGKKHGLDLVCVMNPDGTMNENAGKFKGLDRYEARKRIVEELKSLGLLEKVEPYTHSVGHCYRCDTVIEPYVSTQWFVKTKPLAEPAVEAVEKGRTRIIPERWTKVYFEWMRNIRDWCISRQIWWGHRIPAWYCQDCGEISVSREDITRCLKCGSENIKQDEDVLDTWFSSALWPFGTMGWPEKTRLLEKFYPTSCLVTGFDILFFWVARMMMMGLKFMGDVPFYDVYIHALVRDEKGQKMSKTRGNVIDPVEMMEEYGTDALRFTLAILAAQGRDIRLSEKKIEAYRNFVNKIWNAARFVFMNLDGFEEAEIEPERLTLADRWILSRLNRTVEAAGKALEEYEFDKYASSIYNFTWHELCDWYIELAKEALYGDDKERKALVQNILVHIFDVLMRLLHPVMPFITEEIWQALPISREADSIMVARFPKQNEGWFDDEAERDMGFIMDVTAAIRNVKADMGIPLTKRVDVIAEAKGREKELIEGYGNYIRALAFTDSISVKEEVERPSKSAVRVVGDTSIYIPLGDVIDFEKEKARLSRELSKVEKELERVNKKLSNRNFLEKAPPEVVEKEKAIKAELEEKRQRLIEALRSIEE